MHRIIRTWAAALLVPAIALIAPAQQATWRVDLQSGRTIPGCRLYGVNDSMLFLMDGGNTAAVRIDAVIGLNRQHSGFWDGAFTGILVGTAVGAMAGAASGNDNSEHREQIIKTPPRYLTYGVLGAVLGFAIGGLAGSGPQDGEPRYDLADSTRAAKAGILRRMILEQPVGR
jgi:hypothetical protein